MVKPQQSSLTSLDASTLSIPFQYQKVVCYQLFYQEQKARFGLLYPFLTQEQINLKIKEKWKHLEADKKKKYSKVVLCVTPLKKSAQDRKLTISTPKYSSAKKKGSFMDNSEVSPLLSTSSSPVISSQEKVQHWLNDPKHGVLENGKKYETTQYALNYGVPEIIEDTPIKPTGILKNKSFRNSSEGQMKAKSNPRVSFSPRNRKTNSCPSEKITTKVGNEFNEDNTSRYNTLIKIKDVFDFEEIENVELYIVNENPQVRHQLKTSSKIPFQKKKSVKKSFHFKDNTAEKKVQPIITELKDFPKQILKTSENKKKPKTTTPISKVLRLPKKSQSKNQTIAKTRNNFSNKPLRLQKDSPKLKPSLKNHPRTDTSIIKQRLHPRHKQSSQESAKSKGFIGDSQQADQLAVQSTFYNRNGLLDGPIISGHDHNVSVGSSNFYEHDAKFNDHNDNFDDHINNFDDDHNDDACYTNHKGLIFGPIPDDHSFIKDKKTNSVEDSTVFTVREKKKDILVDDVFPKETKTFTKRQRTKFHTTQQIQPTKALDSLSSEKTKPMAKQSTHHTTEITKSKKHVNNHDMDDSIIAKGAQITRQNKMQPSSDKDKEQNPLSPASSILCEADNSVKDIESSSIASRAEMELSPQISRSKTTLAKVLSRIKQIASPIQLPLESSPTLLSPALSDISQFSSLSKASSDHGDRILRLLDEKKHILKGFYSQNENQISKQWSKRPKVNDLTTHTNQENDLLCDMFQDMTPPEKKKMKQNQRRLVTSNSKAKIKNSENMLEEDIFI